MNKNIHDKAKSLIYPEVQKIKWIGGTFTITKTTKIAVTGNCPTVRKVAKLFRNELSDNYGLNLQIVNSYKTKDKCIILCKVADISEIKEFLKIRSGHKAFKSKEGYGLFVDKEQSIIVASDAQGIFYGIQTFLQLMKKKGRYFEANEVIIYDWPDKPIRGMHCYLPERQNIPFLKRLIKLLAGYKYNTLFIEVGGKMEYERHPRINQNWKRFAKKVVDIEQNHPDIVEYFRRSFGFPKNSTHTEPGSLSKEEVKNLVDFAKGYYFEVIPEVQSLSHSYYLACAYPEIAENKDDPYPDTYCPSNPKTYNILFDVMEEVIEVFKPRWMHIGHDEVYTLGKCSCCRKKTGTEIFAQDINKIHEFLSQRDIGVMMWGDKLLNITTPDGKRYGGVQCKRWVKYDPMYTLTYNMPRTYPAVDRIPKDIRICDWYWRLDNRTEDYFARKGFQVIFGNFSGFKFLNWQKRLAKKNVLGAEVYTWCEVSENIFGRDGRIFDLLFSINMLWRGNYGKSFKENTLTKLISVFPLGRSNLHGDKLPPSIEDGEKEYLCVDISEVSSEQEEVFRCNLPTGRVILEGIPFQINSIKERGDISYIVVGGESHNAVEINFTQKVDSFVFLHTCNVLKEFRPSWEFVDPKKEIIGYYKIVYQNKTRELVPIRFGSNISHWSMEYGNQPSSLCYFAHPAWREKTEEGRDITIYSFEWVNPKPEKVIKEIKIMPTNELDKGEIMLLAITGIKLRQGRG